MFKKLAHRLMLGLALLAFASGCSSLGVMGTNTYKFSYPEPDEFGRVRLAFRSTGDATRATFQIRNAPTDLPEASGEISVGLTDRGASGSQCADVDEDVFCAELDVTTLPANIYLVDVFFNDDEAPAGTLSFYAPGFALEDETATP